MDILTKQKTDSADTGPLNLDKVYGEGAQWVRMSNAITWQMASVFVPASIGCVGLAIAEPPYKIFLGAASLLLFGTWIYVSKLYRESTVAVRDSLMHIEQYWKIPARMAPFARQGQIGLRPFGLMRVQYASMGVLIIFWVLFWAKLIPAQ